LGSPLSVTDAAVEIRESTILFVIRPSLSNTPYMCYRSAYKYLRKKRTVPVRRGQYFRGPADQNLKRSSRLHAYMQGMQHDEPWAERTLQYAFSIRLWGLLTCHTENVLMGEHLVQTSLTIRKT
jgi:hypothetical protein